jgi:hypothetical protein
MARKPRNPAPLWHLAEELAQLSRVELRVTTGGAPCPHILTLWSPLPAWVLGPQETQGPWCALSLGNKPSGRWCGWDWVELGSAGPSWLPGLLSELNFSHVPFFGPQFLHLCPGEGEGHHTSRGVCGQCMSFTAFPPSVLR